MAGFDWLDLSQRENQIYLVNVANDLEIENKKLRNYLITCEEQETYIKELEKQVKLLQKTLDVINKNKFLGRKGRCRYGRSPMDKVIH
jgi:hypothetical protein